VINIFADFSSSGQGEKLFGRWQKISEDLHQKEWNAFKKRVKKYRFTQK